MELKHGGKGFVVFGHEYGIGAEKGHGILLRHTFQGLQICVIQNGFVEVDVGKIEFYRAPMLLVQMIRRFYCRVFRPENHRQFRIALKAVKVPFS